MPLQKKCKYIKFYNFLLPTKWKNKNGLMKDNVKIENTKIKVIKQERIWNDNREEKNGERERWYVLQLWVKPPRRVAEMAFRAANVAKEISQP